MHSLLNPFTAARLEREGVAKGGIRCGKEWMPRADIRRGDLRLFVYVCVTATTCLQPLCWEGENRAAMFSRKNLSIIALPTQTALIYSTRSKTTEIKMSNQLICFIARDWCVIGHRRSGWESVRERVIEIEAVKMLRYAHWYFDCSWCKEAWLCYSAIECWWTSDSFFLAVCLVFLPFPFSFLQSMLQDWFY